MATERQIATATAARLLHEIVHFQTCLNEVKADPRRAYLIEPYRDEIRKRRAKLDAMPALPEAVADPWS